MVSHVAISMAPSTKEEGTFLEEPLNKPGRSDTE